MEPIFRNAVSSRMNPWKRWTSELMPHGLRYQRKNSPFLPSRTSAMKNAVRFWSNYFSMMSSIRLTA